VSRRRVRGRHSRPRVALVVAVLVASGALAACGAGGNVEGAPSGSEVVADTTTTTAPPGPRTISLAFSGDILIHSPLWKQAARTAGGNGYDFTPMFADLAQLLESVDLAVCHLEVPVAPPGTEPSTFPKYGAPAEIVAAIGSAGFDRCSTASNHSMDKGVAGVTATLDEFDANGLSQTGMRRSEADAGPSLIEVGGVTVAHMSYTWAANGIDLPRGEPWRVGILTSERVIADAAAARAAGAEAVVVSLHWGLESSSAPVGHQRELSREITASGTVDLIVGHHAHVIQPIEQVNGVWTVFGLGNMLSNMPPDNGYYPPETQDGMVAVVEITVGGDGTVTVGTPTVHPTWVDKSNGFVIREVRAELADPALSGQKRGRLQASLERTTSVVGDFLAVD